MTREEKFHHLQSQWQVAEEKVQDFDYALKRQYGDQNGYCWNVPNGKRERQDRLDAAESRACERFVAFLERVNPDRRWRSGFPIGFLQDRLTWEDATTRDAMSVTPPPAYGYTTRDAEAFSGPIA